MHAPVVPERKKPVPNYKFNTTRPRISPEMLKIPRHSQNDADAFQILTSDEILFAADTDLFLNRYDQL